MPENFYRKWRPRTFGELAGQEHVATTLTNALGTGRVAHAYLFAGPRGTGKTSTGRLLGKALNCTDRHNGEPCNACSSCIDYNGGRAMDLIELDAASNRGIDEIRSLRDKVAFAPGAGAFKVYLIDEVHMLTDAAFNALLKTLEEPPPHVVFILATTESHRVPATILSRCQRFDFRRVPMAAAVKCLEGIASAEGINAEPAALELIARSATGSMRDAINLLDQLATSYGSELGVEHVKTGLGLIGDERASALARCALAGDLAGGLGLIASVRDDGLDLRQFQRELVDELRALLLVKAGAAPPDGATRERLQEMHSTVAAATTAGLLTALRAFGEADLKQDPNSTLPLDIALADCVLGADGQSGNRATAQPLEAPAVRAATADARPPATRGSTGSPRTEMGAPRTDIGPSRTEMSASQTESPALSHEPVGAQTPGPPSPLAEREPGGEVAPPAHPRTPKEPETVAGVPPAHPEALEGRAEPPTDAASNGRADLSADEEPPETPEAAGFIPQSTDLPPSPPPAAPGALDLAAAREKMPAIYEKLKADKADFRRGQVAAFINGPCDIIRVGESSLTIAFKYPVHAKKFEDREYLKLLSEAVSDVLGTQLSVNCVHDPEVESWQQREKASRSPLVRAAQEMGARVLASGPED